MNATTHTSKLFIVTLLLLLSNCIQPKIQKETIEEIDTNTQKHPMPMLKLFIYPNCPYCKKVIDALHSKGNAHKVLLCDANLPKYQAELRTLSNTSQCPFLYDPEKDVRMLESYDIINYLNNRFNN